MITDKDYRKPVHVSAHGLNSVSGSALSFGFEHDAVWYFPYVYGENKYYNWFPGKILPNFYLMESYERWKLTIWEMAVKKIKCKGKGTGWDSCQLTLDVSYETMFLKWLNIKGGGLKGGMGSLFICAVGFNPPPYYNCQVFDG